jgi:protein TonB
MEKRKYADADIDSQRKFFYAIGFVVSFAILLVAFEWKSFKEIIVQEVIAVKASGPVEELQAVIIPNAAPAAAPPPPNVVEVIQIVDNDKVIENEMDVQNMDAPDEITVAVSSGPVGNSTGDEPVADEEAFMVVEEMPRFSGCEDIKDEDKAAECFNREVGKFLGKNINYPQRAKEAGIEGTVFISFVVGSDGNVKDVKILRGIGYGCDEEATRVISKLPKFKPGMQRGRATPVIYSLPINFKLK